MENNEKKVLLKITNLKQWFPLKKKGLYVKANDGITLDIYEGETFGLVGESGCGKSTLGRTLLQLYKQTDGRSMYYGRSLYEIAPQYVIKTLNTIDKKHKKWIATGEKVKELEKEYNALEEGSAKYNKANELSKARSDENNELLDMANLIGGFIAIDNRGEAIVQFKEIFKFSQKRKSLQKKLKAAKLNFDDLDFRIKKEGGDTQKLAKYQQQITEIEKEIDAVDAEIKKVNEKLDEMRKPYADNAEFQKYEALRDDGVDLARLSYNEIRDLRSDLQLIFQDPYSSLNPRMTVGNIIGEGLLAHGFFKRNDERMQEYIIKVMEDAGLASYFIQRFPHQFSGGQRQRIGIARSLAVKPKFVVCDEAVSALDVSIQSQIINLLYDLKQQSNLTYMFITHDLSVVKYISDRIGVMYLGNMVELAETQEIFDHPTHPYTESLIAAIPTTDVDNDKELRILEGDIPSPVNPPKGCKFHTRCAHCTEKCKEQVPEWVEIAPNHFVACHYPLEYNK